MFHPVMNREIHRIGLILIILNLLVPLLLICYGAVLFPRTEEYRRSRSRFVKAHPVATVFRGEENAITWFSSVQLILTSVVAYGNYRLARHARSVDPNERTRPWIWLIFALGCLFLALDEQFSYHEYLREDILKPRDLFTSFKYIKPGDIGLYLIFVVGVIFAFFLFPLLRAKTSSLWLFVTALGLALVVAIFDSLKHEFRGMPRSVQIPGEEILECWVELLFFLSFLGFFRFQLDKLVSRRADPVSAPPAGKSPEAT